MSFHEPGPDVAFAERKPLIEDERLPAEIGAMDRLIAAAQIDRAHLKVLSIIFLTAVLASIWLFWHSRAKEDFVALPRPTISESQQLDLSHPESSPASADVVVDVGGRVRHPGVYSLPTGSRAIDALTAAGGPLPGTDLTTINQAQTLEDGEQIVVGEIQGATSANRTAQTGKVNLNSASLEQLDVLPGIGPVLASRIVAWRKAHGRFKTIDDLRQVSGVGDAKFADLRPLVRI
ncbi:MAG TPA: ComEA family DNA-binding protein [Candidatus Nanopelagicaceae bacterium]|nr:ComEA family DNA-binding protein [Candidatus Nanopelagicaceae bacterium]